MKLLQMAQAYVRIQEADDSFKDESWETPRQRAESVLAAFLRDQNEPVWNVKFIWKDDDENIRTQNSYFILEETADSYIVESAKYHAKAPVGPPTEVQKCMTSPR